MARARGPPLPPGRALRRSLSSLATPWCFDQHRPLRASVIALASMAAAAAEAATQPPSPPSSASCAGTSRRRKRVSMEGGRPSSPSERSTNESLRSTQLTATSSDLLGMMWDDDDDDNDAASLDSRRLPRLSDWVYWQRDAANLPDCWTRVFAVYKAPQLWLYRYELTTPQSLLLRIKVTRVEAGRDGTRQLKLMDADACRNVRICMLDDAAYEEWRLRIRDDVYALADELMEQRASDNLNRQLAVVTRDRRSSSTGSKHGGALARALSTAVTNLKKSHSEPLGFGRLRRDREPLEIGAPPSALATKRAELKASGWRTVKTALSGVWKHGAERKQLDG